jgi:hypothetical protein
MNQSIETCGTVADQMGLQSDVTKCNVMKHPNITFSLPLQPGSDEYQLMIECFVYLMIKTFTKIFKVCDSKAFDDACTKFIQLGYISTAHCSEKTTRTYSDGVLESEQIDRKYHKCDSENKQTYIDNTAVKSAQTVTKHTQYINIEFDCEHYELTKRIYSHENDNTILESEKISRRSYNDFEFSSDPDYDFMDIEKFISADNTFVHMWQMIMTEEFKNYYLKYLDSENILDSVIKNILNASDDDDDNSDADCDTREEAQDHLINIHDLVIDSDQKANEFDSQTKD